MIKVKCIEVLQYMAAKELLHDLKCDISHIKSFEEFEEERPILIGWIDRIKTLLGIKE